MVVVAAVDGSAQAQAVLAEADALAERFEKTIHVLHVMERSEAIAVEESSVDDDAISVEALRERAAAVGDELLRSHPTTAPAESIGRIGDPATEIVAHADDHDARYIVVSPQQRSQTGKLLFGSVAQSVLLNANCPVVSLRAEKIE